MVREPRHCRAAPPPAQPRRVQGRRLAPRRALRALGHGRVRLQGRHDRHRGGASCCRRSNGSTAVAIVRQRDRRALRERARVDDRRRAHVVVRALVAPPVHGARAAGHARRGARRARRARHRRGGQLPRRAHAQVLQRAIRLRERRPSRWPPTSASAPSRFRSTRAHRSRGRSRGRRARRDARRRCDEPGQRCRHSVVVPLYNEEANVRELAERLVPVLEQTRQALRDRLRRRRQPRPDVGHGARAVAARSRASSSSASRATTVKRRRCKRASCARRAAGSSRWTAICRTRPKSSSSCSQKRDEGFEIVYGVRAEAQRPAAPRARVAPDDVGHEAACSASSCPKT